MKHMNCDTLVLGATFFGVGLSLSSKNKTIVVERTSLVGSEFVDSFNEKEVKKIDIRTPMGQDFEKNLASRNLLKETGAIYSAPAMFVLCDYIRKSGLNILFLTEVTQIQKTGEGYEITLFNCEGFTTVSAKKIIDTTSGGVMHTSIIESDAKKYLNSILFHPQNDSLPDWGHVAANEITKKSVFFFPVALEDDWLSARAKLFDFVAKNQDTSKGWKIALVSSTFAYSIPRTNKQVDDHFDWIPSCAYDNLLHAFDQGGLLC